MSCLWNSPQGGLQLVKGESSNQKRPVKPADGGNVHRVPLYKNWRMLTWVQVSVCQNGPVSPDPFSNQISSPESTEAPGGEGLSRRRQTRPSGLFTKPLAVHAPPVPRRQAEPVPLHRQLISPSINSAQGAGHSQLLFIHRVPLNSAYVTTVLISSLSQTTQDQWIRMSPLRILLSPFVS